jgi:hypothetical protein
VHSSYSTLVVCPILRLTLCARISGGGVTIENTGTTFLSVLDRNGTEIGGLDLKDSKTFNLQPSTSLSPFTVSAGGISIATITYPDQKSLTVKAGDPSGKSRFTLTVPMDA